ncbi:MAG: FtsL-like putative cell division protein [Bacteroidota bacterium]
MNRYKVNKTEKVSVKSGKKKSSKVVRNFRDVLNGNVLARDYVIDNLPFIFFCTFLMLCYIGMGYNTDKNTRAIEKTESDLIELNSEYLSLASEFNMLSSESQIEDSTAVLGLHVIRDEKPKVIQVEKNEIEKLY